jgi:hypothetical protein
MQFIDNFVPNSLRYPHDFYLDFIAYKPLGYRWLAELVRMYRRKYGIRSRHAHQ